MPRLRWTGRSRRDLLEIGRYIAQDKPGAARRWVARLRQRALRAAKLPNTGRQVPELGREDIREIVERGYRIVYRLVDQEVHVLTVFEIHRLLRPAELELED